MNLAHKTFQPFKISLLLLCLLTCWHLFANNTVHAHALKFGVAQITEQPAAMDPDTASTPFEYRVSFQYSGVNTQPESMQLQLPIFCQQNSPQVEKYVKTNRRQDFNILCEQPLTEGVLGISGLKENGAQVLVNIKTLKGDNLELHLDSNQWEINLAQNKNLSPTVSAYLSLGVEHILLGIDHLLFVLALLLLVGITKKLILVITSFTLGHSITLGLASLGHITLPAPPVEALIALSILLLAAEAIKNPDDPTEQTLTQRYPQWAAIAFGLFHGLGFAGALEEIGLPEDAWFESLLMFNIGIELGQIAFICVIALAISLFHKSMNNKAFTAMLSQRVKLTTAYAIGTLAAFWFFERSAQIFLPTAI